jgi:hypothetical protein
MATLDDADLHLGEVQALGHVAGLMELQSPHNVACFLCVDSGQLTSVAWTSIEAGNGPFCDLSQVSPLRL